MPPIADTRELCYNTFKWRKAGAFFRIMRALGAGIRDVFSIYFMEGILIAVIGCAVSIALLVVLTPIANLLLQDYLSIKLSILTFGFRQAITIALLSFGIAFVASIIPILRIARQKPVDAIRKN